MGKPRRHPAKEKRVGDAIYVSEQEAMRAAFECRSCRGYGHFDERDKPTIDRRCRKCLDCNGLGTRL